MELYWWFDFQRNNHMNKCWFENLHSLLFQSNKFHFPHPVFNYTWHGILDIERYLCLDKVLWLYTYLRIQQAQLIIAFDAYRSYALCNYASCVNINASVCFDRRLWIMAHMDLTATFWILIWFLRYVWIVSCNLFGMEKVWTAIRSWKDIRIWW